MENPIEAVENAIDRVEEKVFEKVTPDNLPSFFSVLKSAYKFCLAHKNLLFLYFFIPLLVSALVNIFGNLFFNIAFKSGSVVAIAITAISILIISLCVGVFNAIITYGSALFFKSLEDRKTHSLNTVVLKNQKTKEAILSSFILTKGKKLYIFVQLLGLVGVTILALLATLLVSVIFFAIFKPLLSINGASAVYLFIATVFHQAVSACLIAFGLVFFYKIYTNLSKSTHHVTKEYLERTEKIIKGFAILGIIFFVSVIVLSFIFGSRIKKEINQKQLEKQIEAQIKASLANPVK